MIDPYSDESLADPVSLWKRLRSEPSVFQVPGSDRLFLVSRHADITEICAQPEIFTNEQVATVQRGPDRKPKLIPSATRDNPQSKVLGAADGEVHKRHRKLLTGSFSARRIRVIDEWLKTRARDLLKAAGSEFDVVEAIAKPLPVHAIVKLVGFPEGDWQALGEGAIAMMTLSGGLAEPEQVPGLMADIAWLDNYAEEQLAHRRGNREEGDAEDVLGLVSAALDNGEIELWEAKGLIMQLIAGGGDTTVSLICSVARRLAENPSWQEILRNDPTQIPLFVEETLRLDGPAIGNPRHVAADCMIGDTPIPKGATMVLLWGSANRDEAVFANAEQFDPKRSDLKKHIAFGKGVHVCLGSILARMETHAVAEALLENSSVIELGCPPEELHQIPGLVIRKLEALPLRIR
ncbi:MAG: cytochrome P450 [Sphingorhabdus sp.]